MPTAPERLSASSRALPWLSPNHRFANSCGSAGRAWREFWATKIARNGVRDQCSSEALASMGWRVLTVWECSLKGRGRKRPGEVLTSCKAFLMGGARNAEIVGRPPKQITTAGAEAPLTRSREETHCLMSLLTSAATRSGMARTKGKDIVGRLHAANDPANFCIKSLKRTSHLRLVCVPVVGGPGDRRLRGARVIEHARDGHLINLQPTHKRRRSA